MSHREVSSAVVFIILLLVIMMVQQPNTSKTRPDPLADILLADKISNDQQAKSNASAASATTPATTAECATPSSPRKRPTSVAGGGSNDVVVDEPTTQEQQQQQRPPPVTTADDVNNASINSGDDAAATTSEPDTTTPIPNAPPGTVDGNGKYRPRARYGWQARLNTPTHVALAFGHWIIVDCWHHRVLYRKREANETDSDLDANKDFVNGWKSLPVGNESLLRIPHSVAYNNKVLVTETSIGGSGGWGEHSILVWELVAHGPATTEVLAEDDTWRLIQRVRACYPFNIAARPHRILFDPGVKAFFLYLTSRHLSRFDSMNDGTNRLQLMWTKELIFVSGGYARSITFMENDMLVTLGPNYVSRFDHRAITNETDSKDIALKVKYYSKSWKINRNSMNDIAYFDGYWYITQTSDCRFYRTPRLPVYVKGKEKSGVIRKTAHYKVESLKNKVTVCRGVPYGRTDMCFGGGTPYYMTKIGSRIYLPYIFGCSGIISFIPGNYSDPVLDYKHHFHPLGWLETVDDMERRGVQW